jgi:hypothetical protein
MAPSNGGLLDPSGLKKTSAYAGRFFEFIATQRPAPATGRFKHIPVAAGERNTMTMNIVTKVKTAVNDSHVVVFNLLINCMSAERQFDLTKLGIDIDTLPSASRKLIQEKIFPKEFLNNYGRLRDRANAELDKGPAVTLPMGVVTSRSEAVSKIQELNKIKADWAKQISDDSVRYDKICNERIALIAAEAYKEGVGADVVNTLVDALRKRQPTWDDFVTRMKFDYTAMPIQLELDETKADFDPVLFQAQREGIVALREGVFGALVQFLARESSDLLKLLNGKKQHLGVYTINYRTVGRIGVITEKLHGLAFVHQNVAPLALVIDEALAFMPKSVEKDLALQPGQFYNLLACLEAMGDQHELLARLRDKQRLVDVTQVPTAQPQGQLSLTKPLEDLAATSAQSTAGNQAIQQHSTNSAIPVDEPDSEALQEAEEETAEASQEEEASTAGQPSFMEFSFTGTSMFE